MFKRTVTPQDLERLRRERDDAHRQYNESLTTLDNALHQLRQTPKPPAEYDEHQITPLNKLWDLLTLKPAITGWQGRIRSFIWNTIAPLFERQHAFNSTLVDHINRNVDVNRSVSKSVTSALELAHDELANTVEFQSALIRYLQTITAYVDTGDREVAGIMRRINEDVAVVSGLEEPHAPFDRVSGLAATISAVSDEHRKLCETMTAQDRRRDRRYDARERALTEQVNDLRSSFSVVNQVTQTLKRELERVLSTPTTSNRKNSTKYEPLGDALDSQKYVGFEDLYRGSTKDIRERLTEYIDEFTGAADVLDIGCGRGEFLELLKERGIPARGIDSNHEMVEVCKNRGLVCDEEDALTFLRGIPDASLGGLFSSQVVEHLNPSYLISALDTAYLKLKPGSKIILETINAASWSAFFHSYIRDITHQQPLHPDTLTYLVTASGFQKVQVRYLSPYPEDFKLKQVPLPSDDEIPNSPNTTAIGTLMTFNENVDKLNRLLFADQDYAVIAERV